MQIYQNNGEYMLKFFSHIKIQRLYNPVLEFNYTLFCRKHS